MKKLIFLSFIFLGVSLNAQSVKWLSFQEAFTKNKKQPKKFLVDIYTDWCQWCKVMDRKTYDNKVIADYINKNYYPIKFNAEMTTPIKFNGKTYKYISQGNRGYHELAYYLLKGKMGYPSTVFLNESLSIIQNISGFLEPKIMEPMLVFFHKDLYNTIPFIKFKKNFVSKL